MRPLPNIAPAAALVADPARAAMLMALIDGRALPAGELAWAAGITAQTASGHLAKLVEGRFLACESEGRHRYYRLAGPEVARLLEQLAGLAPPLALHRKPLSREAKALRHARRCYDHLAGELGVAVAQALVERGCLASGEGKQFLLTEAGRAWFGALGIEVGELKPTRRGLARQCLDWTERRHHLAGPLGVALLSRLCALGWLRRSRQSRIIGVTPLGARELQRTLGILPGPY